jgi:predicted neutral ceramidase superfamily lipid hydrolase
MTLSKKEISILIEIVFSILFTLIFLPYFYRNQETSFVFSELMGKVTEIIIFSAIYFSIAYSLLEFIYKNKITEDERSDMINSKSYKLGYLLYEFSLFIFIGTLINYSIHQNGGIIFLILALLLIVSVIKSSYQFYLHRTF